MSPSMQERFTPFRRKSKLDFNRIWSTAEFTFDANVLLALYGSPRVVMDEFARYLAALSDRFYLTDQVVLEFYRNRERVINQARNGLGTLDNVISSIPMAFSDAAQAELNRLLTEEKKNLDNYLNDGDSIEKMLNDSVGDRIDQPFEDVIAMHAEIDKRYLSQVPPGFADLDEKEDYKKYGDAILWLQVIEHQRRTKKPLVLVTSDSKHDWWVKDSQNKIVGPRPELGHELWVKAGVQFHLYTFTQFLKFAANHFPAKAAGRKNEAEAVKAAEQIESKRDAESQAAVEVNRTAESFPYINNPIDLYGPRTDLNSIRLWGSPAFRDKMLKFQTQMESLNANPVSNLPGPNSLHSYIERLENSRLSDAVRNYAAHPFPVTQFQSGEIRPAPNSLNSIYQSPSNPIYRQVKSDSAEKREIKKKKPKKSARRK